MRSYDQSTVGRAYQRRTQHDVSRAQGSLEKIQMGPMVNLQPNTLRFSDVALPVLSVWYNATSFAGAAAQDRKLELHWLNVSGSWEPVPGSYLSQQPGLVSANIHLLATYVVMSVPNTAAAQNRITETLGPSTGVEDQNNRMVMVAIFVAGVASVITTSVGCLMYFGNKDKQSKLANMIKEEDTRHRTIDSNAVFNRSEPVVISDVICVALPDSSRAAGKIVDGGIEAQENSVDDEVQPQPAQKQPDPLQSLALVYQGQGRVISELVTSSQGGIVMSVPQHQPPKCLRQTPEPAEPSTTLCSVLNLADSQGLDTAMIP